VKLLQLLVAARQRYSTIHTTRDSKHTVSSTPLYKISVSQGSDDTDLKSVYMLHVIRAFIHVVYKAPEQNSSNENIGYFYPYIWQRSRTKKLPIRC